VKLVDNVTVLPVVTSLPIPVERVLTAAMDIGLASVVVIGYTQDGEKFWFAASEPDGPSTLWALEQAKRKLLEISE
jgi:hypothetical protein